MHKYAVIKQISRTSNPTLILNPSSLKYCQTDAKLKHENNSSKPRINQVGIQMINEKLRNYLFNERNEVAKSDVQKAEEHLKKFGLFEKESVPAEDISDQQLRVPGLKGKNIEEHFFNIGREQTAPYLKLFSKLANNGIPPMPKHFEFQPGWTRYDMKTNKTVRVDYPADDALVFDVESLVLHKNCPVIAVAVSDTAWYAWCSKRLISNDFLYLNHLQLDDLIPFESENEKTRKNRRRIIVGHNVGFDRSYIKEQYYLEKSALRFLDTMSMHISCSGFSHEQRDVILNKNSVDLTQTINRNQNGKNSYKDLTKQNFEWKQVGSLNNLKDVHSLYNGFQDELNKDSREIFVKGGPQDVIDNFQSLMRYCANDVKATYDIFRKLITIYLDRFPHPVTLNGTLEMSTMYLPINQNWTKYLENCGNAFDDSEFILNKLLVRAANDACKYQEQKDKDPWLKCLDWSKQSLSFSKNATNKIENEEKNETVSNTKMLKQKKFLIESLRPDSLESNPFYKTSSKATKYKIKDSLENFSASQLTNKIFYLGKFLPKNAPSLCGYPKWFKELITKSKVWQPNPTQVSTRLRIMPNLLRLTWNGRPMHYDSHHGWGFHLSKEEYDEYVSKSEKKNANIRKSKTKKAKEPKVYEDGKVFMKIPHKDGDKMNVGNPLSKSFLSKINDGIMSSIPDDFAGLAVQLNKVISYWEMNLKRINAQKAIILYKNNQTPCGAIVPITAVAGTITRRAVEPMWLTATNYSKDRIGCEVKTMIQSPHDYAIVGADVDSQELWIAATIGDSNFAKIHGSTALGWMNLEGKKSDGTDMHSKTASIIGITRDQAKVFNYGRIYGAGNKFAIKLLMQFNPLLTEEEAKQKADDLYLATKGKKERAEHGKKNTKLEKIAREMGLNKTDLQDLRTFEEEKESNVGKWIGGTESEMFNKLEEIARCSSPRTPVLNARITRTLEPKRVDEAFITSRINWVVQSSAVDYLHLMLTCMEWLINEYKIEARFLISIHDEVRYLVREEDKYRLALALQITNLFTRAMFSSKLGLKDLPLVNKTIDPFFLLTKSPKATIISRFETKSVAFFSAVDIDKCLRKEPDLDFVSPSNPNGLEKGYNIPKGKCMDIYEIIEKTNGTLFEHNSVK